MPMYDITICSGDGCSIKAFCHRYQVYKSIPKGHNDLVSHTDPSNPGTTPTNPDDPNAGND